MMNGRRAIKKSETRQAIMQAAIRLFSEQGVENTSIEELAAAAGVGKGTIYGYFQTKDEIFLAFCEEEVDYAFTALAEQSDPQAPILERLMTLFMSQFRFVTANHEFGRLMAREMAFPRQVTARKSKDLEGRYLEALGEMIKAAKARGELRSDCDPFLASGHFYGLYLVTLSGWYSGYMQDYDAAEVIMRAVFTQALQGLGSNSESSVAKRGGK
jgi:AcrR family transcriptional regulator